MLMLFFGTLMDMAQMFSPPAFHLQNSGTLKHCHCDAALVESDGDPPLKMDTVPRMDAAHGPISINKLPFPLWLFESFLLV